MTRSNDVVTRYVRPPLVIVPDRPEWLRKSKTLLVDGERHFRRTAMRKKGWCVAPLPDSITDEQASALATAAQKRSIDEAIACTTQSAVNEEQYIVPMTLAGVVAFEFSCLLRYFLLAPREVDFAILHEANYYWLLAGPPEFIVECLGVSAEQAITAFLSDYAGAEDWPEQTTQMLREVARYRELCSSST
jgi:hypothetical protein